MLGGFLVYLERQLTPEAAKPQPSREVGFNNAPAISLYFFRGLSRSA
jgi:hypothetical protein